MVKQKPFDSVEMKRAIQQRLDEEFAGMTAAQVREAQRQRVAGDPVLGPFLRKVRERVRIEPAKI